MGFYFHSLFFLGIILDITKYFLNYHFFNGRWIFSNFYELSPSQYSLLSPWKHQKTFGFLIFSGGSKASIGKKRVNYISLKIVIEDYLRPYQSLWWSVFAKLEQIWANQKESKKMFHQIYFRIWNQSLQRCQSSVMLNIDLRLFP